jgi:hypothetical protein
MVKAGQVGGIVSLSALRAKPSPAGNGFAVRQVSGELPRRPSAAGPLSVLISNPRYFTDGSGKATYLAGSHSWWNMQDSGIRLISAED